MIMYLRVAVRVSLVVVIARSNTRDSPHYQVDTSVTWHAGKVDGCVIAWRSALFTAVRGSPYFSCFCSHSARLLSIDSHHVVDYNALCHLCGGTSAYDNTSKKAPPPALIGRSLRNRFLRHNLGHY